MTGDLALHLDHLVLVNLVEDLFRRGGAVDLLQALQDFAGKIRVLGRKEFLSDGGQAIGLFGTPHAFGPAPGVEIAILFESDTMLLNPHVREINAFA